MENSAVSERDSINKTADPATPINKNSSTTGSRGSRGSKDSMGTNINLKVEEMNSATAKTHSHSLMVPSTNDNSLKVEESCDGRIDRASSSPDKLLLLKTEFTDKSANVTLNVYLTNFLISHTLRLYGRFFQGHLYPCFVG